MFHLPFSNCMVKEKKYIYTEVQKVKLIASVEFFTRACMFHLPFSNCMVKEKKYIYTEVQKVKLITNRFQILQ
jgi:hypothetical protein